MRFLAYVYDCAQWHTKQHTAVLVIFSFVLHKHLVDELQRVLDCVILLTMLWQENYYYDWCYD